MAFKRNKSTSAKKKKIRLEKVASGQSPEFTILKKGLEEAIQLKSQGNYQDRDFDSLVDQL
jgi:hypothetical protein